MIGQLHVPIPPEPGAEIQWLSTAEAGVDKRDS
jgi:hypothetical protein